MSDVKTDTANDAVQLSGKELRKRRIVAAARALIRESDETSFSMRTLADKAEVSLATPYNLFGSRREIVLKVFEYEAETFGIAFEARAAESGIRRILELNDFTFEYYVRDEKYFIALLGELYRSSDALLHIGILRARSSFLKHLVRHCVEIGELDPILDVDLFVRSLVSLHSHIAQDWTLGILTHDQARLQIAYGQCLVLLSMATRRAYPVLLDSLTKVRADIDASHSTTQPSTDHFVRRSGQAASGPSSQRVTRNRRKA